MWDKIVFFELGHYGDLHITRNFVRYVMSNVRARKYVYVLKADCRVLADFPGLEFEGYNPTLHPFTDYSSWFTIDSTFYINTSCGADAMSFHEGANVLTAYNIFKHFFHAAFNLTLPDITTFVPSVNYGRFKIAKVDEFMKLHEGKKKILIVNGDTQSGQTLNFDMYPLVQILAYKHPDCVFLISNRPTSLIYKRMKDEDRRIVSESNIYYCQDILQIDGNDIVECAYFSTYCDLIVGRSSGVYSLSIEKRNVIDNPKKFICISFVERDKDLGMTTIFPNLKDNFIWTNDFNFGSMVDLIEQHI